MGARPGVGELDAVRVRGRWRAPAGALPGAGLPGDLVQAAARTRGRGDRLSAAGPRSLSGGRGRSYFVAVTARMMTA